MIGECNSCKYCTIIKLELLGMQYRCTNLKSPRYKQRVSINETCKYYTMYIWKRRKDK